MHILSFNSPKKKILLLRWLMCKDLSVAAHSTVTTLTTVCPTQHGGRLRVATISLNLNGTLFNKNNWIKKLTWNCCSLKTDVFMEKQAWPCFLGSKRYRKLEGWGDEEEGIWVGGWGWGHSGRGGVTSKPTSKGINNCFCWFCCCDMHRQSSKWQAGSFDLRQPSWRGFLPSAAQQREARPPD